jgi:ankyrin repeat protein
MGNTPSETSIFDIPDINTPYRCSSYTLSSGFTLLMKLVMLTREYPTLEAEIKKHIDENPETINVENNEGWTALMLASRNSKTHSTENTVKMLIDAGADLNIQNHKYHTALMLAVRYSNKDSTENTVKMLIDAKASLNIQNIGEYTALMSAVGHSDRECIFNTVKMLIDAGANLNIQNSVGCTALMLVVGYPDKDSTENTVKMLIDAKANLNIQNDDHDTVLTIALKNEKYNIAKMLIDAGAEINTQNMTKNMKNICNLMLEVKELKKINEKLVKENNILKDTLEFHPDSDKIKELKDHFMALTNNSLN